MKSESAVLRLVPDGWSGPAVELALDAAPPALALDPEGGWPAVFSNRAYRIEVAGPALLVPSAVTVSINGEPCRYVQSERGADSIALRPQESWPFRDVFGLAHVEVALRRPGAVVPLVLHAEPALVLLPEGQSSRNVSAMAARVCAAYDRLFAEPDGGEGTSAGLAGGRGEAASAKSSAEALTGQEAALERLVRLYETHFAWFRSNARRRLAEREEVGAFERLKRFSQKTLEFIVRHPEELSPAPGSDGVKPHGFGQAWIPRHTLVTSSAPSADIYENRVIVGFLDMLARDVDGEERALAAAAAALPRAKVEVPEGYLASTAAIFAESARRLDAAAERFAALRGRILELRSLYERALGLRGAEFTWPPKLTPTFLRIAPYRQIFEAMTAWRAAPPPGLREETLLLACIERSRLYEYYVLAELLEGLEREGFRPVRTARFAYAGACGLVTGEDGLPQNNTFVFERDGAEVTLWSQPVISTGATAGENDLGLARVCEWSISQSDSDPNRMKRSDRPFYTPDFVFRVRPKDAAGAVYLIADAKYSRMERVLLTQTDSLVFRYLFSVRPMRPGDRAAGLWLLCGADHENPELSTSALTAGVRGPRLELERLDPSGAAGSLLRAVSAAARGEDL